MTQSHNLVDRFSRRGMIVLALAGWFGAGGFSVSAAPMTIATTTTHHHAPSVQILAFNDYLAWGPKHWTTTGLMPVPAGVHVRNAQGELKDNATVDYLMWVRDHHPVYFDRHHPVLGPMLAEAQAIRGTEYLMATSKLGRSGHHATAHTSSSAATPQAQAVSTTSTSDKATHAATQTTLSTTSQVHILETPTKTTIVLPHIALEELTPPPPKLASSSPLLAQEILSSTVVTTNAAPAQRCLDASPQAIPEPSTVALTLLLFGSAAGWHRWRAGS